MAPTVKEDIKNPASPPEATGSKGRYIEIENLNGEIKMYTYEISRAPAAKKYIFMTNIGVAYYRVAELCDPKYYMKELMVYLGEAVKCYCNAWKCGPYPQSSAWSLQMDEYMSDTFRCAFSTLQSITPVAKRLTYIHYLDSIGNAFEFNPAASAAVNHFRCRYHLAKGQFYHRCGVEALDSKDIQSSLRLCDYCRKEKELALRYSNKKEHADEIKQLEKDYSSLRMSCESIRYGRQAEEKATKAKGRTKDLPVPNIKKAIQKLDEKAKIGSVELLKYLYSTHPPKSVPAFKYNPKETTALNLKKTLMKAVTHYHPDKQVNYGMEWKVLCEEITKVLTAKYERMKL